MLPVSLARAWWTGAAVLMLGACGSSAKDYLRSLQHYPTPAAGLPHSSAASSGLPRGIVLHWEVRQFVWGTEELALHQDGTLYYYYDPAEGSGGRAVDIVTSTSTESIETLSRLMETSRFCQLQSKRPGIPDEGRSRLAVRLGDIDCAVSLADDEWLELPAAAAVLAALEPLRDRTE